VRLVVVDNYDSFTHNLVDLLERLGASCEVVMNDEADLPSLVGRRPAAFVISPGPCTPTESGVSLDLARAGVTGALGAPLFGVCLGLQAIAAAAGGAIVRAARPLHGKTSLVYHDGRGMFAAVSQPFAAARYNSLLADRATLPPDLEVTAWTAEAEVMALAHVTYPVEAVQFHPESFLTTEGPRLVARWLASLGDTRARSRAPAASQADAE
jgi:anthranilate synthase/aminodeoxychorismate synthase-like glutamine amidotransferase